MARKNLLPNQHRPLHFLYGDDDCCLCRLEAANKELQSRIDELERERAPQGVTVLTIPALFGRIETGALQINSDWPGIFIRGDDCMRLPAVIDHCLKSGEFEYERVFLEDLLAFIGNALGKEKRQATQEG